jgi:hypothetical protein
MGLAISVGILADLIIHDAEGADWVRRDFEKINEVLRENNLPEHHEPEKLSEIGKRRYGGGFPYSYLHYLRRVAAHSFQDENWKASPFPESEDPADDIVLDKEMYMMHSHLLCHSDSKGYYVPIDFSDVLIDMSSKKRIRGGMLGSTHKLMSELVQIAPALNIEVSEGVLSDEEVKRISMIDYHNNELFREYIVWLTLFESARVSLESKTAIVFT